MVLKSYCDTVKPCDIEAVCSCMTRQAQRAAVENPCCSVLYYCKCSSVLVQVRQDHVPSMLIAFFTFYRTISESEQHLGSPRSLTAVIICTSVQGVARGGPCLPQSSIEWIFNGKNWLCWDVGPAFFQ